CGRDRVRGRVRRTGDRAVGFSFADEHIAEIKRIAKRFFGFLKRYAFCTTHLVINIRKSAEVAGAAMVDDIDAVQVKTALGRARTQLVLLTDQRYACDLLTRTNFRGFQ